MSSLICVFLVCFICFTNSFSSKLNFRSSSRLKLTAKDSRNVHDKKDNFNLGDVASVDNPQQSIAEDVFGSPVSPLPTVSAKVNWADIKVDEGNICDLWIVGCGTLGTCVAEMLRHEMSEGMEVVAETRTDARHEALKILGCTPRLRSSRDGDGDGRRARNVLVCLPPSSSEGSSDYSRELSEAFMLWAGPKYGNLLFTSSISVYGDSGGNVVDELFRVDSRTARSKKMIEAEEQILQREGSVIRLAGLYSEKRGPHAFWLQTGAVTGSPDGIVNLVHYDDAASACFKAL